MLGRGNSSKGGDGLLKMYVNNWNDEAIEGVDAIMIAGTRNDSDPVHLALCYYGLDNV